MLDPKDFVGVSFLLMSAAMLAAAAAAVRVMPTIAVNAEA